MSFLLACIDHRLARLESAARTFLRSDLHLREARAAVERDVFDGADALADAEAEAEVHEPDCNCMSFGDDDDAQYCTTHRCPKCPHWDHAGNPCAACSCVSIFMEADTYETGPRHTLTTPGAMQDMGANCAAAAEMFPQYTKTARRPLSTTNVPADLAASGDSPAAESEPPSPAAGHSTLLLKAAAIICDLQQYGPVSDARFKSSVNPIIGRLHDAAWQLADERAK